MVLETTHMVGLILRDPMAKKGRNHGIWVCTTHYYILKSNNVYKGFFKLTMMDGETVIHDGHKDVSLFWDYCGFSSGDYTICYYYLSI
jgi:hypothetical protein